MMSYEFQWEAGEMENENDESFDAPVYQPQQRRGAYSHGSGEMEGEYDEQEGSYDEMEGSYADESSFGNYEGEQGNGELEAEDAESVFDEMEEMELAAELLSLSDEQEIDQFIGKIIRSAGKAVGSVISGPVGQALGGLLKAAARQSLPMFRGHARRGGGRMFGLEVEGLSGEDQEFELARRYVRLGGAAGGRAARAPRRIPPRVAARRSLVAAARRFAPGLLRRLHRGRRHHRRDHRGPFGRPGTPGVPPYGYPYPQPQQYPGMADQQAGPGGLMPGDSGQGQAPPEFAGGGSQDSGADGAFQGPMPQSGQWSRQGRQLTIIL